jgi:hypothetical protein
MVTMDVLEKQHQKSWSDVVIPSSSTEFALFRACTRVTVRNGASSSFWEDQWLQGQGPRQLAPALYKLAWRKKLPVAQAWREGRWMWGLQRVITTQEINQFVALWSMINNIQLSDNHDDISWWFTADGQYLTWSAYRVQFLGSFADNDWSRLWKAGAENKCKFWP